MNPTISNSNTPVVNKSAVGKLASSKSTRSLATSQARQNSVPENASLKTSPPETIVKPSTVQLPTQSPVQSSAQLTSAQLTSAQLASAQLASAQLASAQLTSAQLTTVSPLQGSPVQRLDNNLTLLQGVVEGLPDGIMILSDRGELTYDNSCARQICKNLLSPNAPTSVPSQVWRCCHALMDSRKVAQAIVIEDEILTAEGTTIRIRVRWLNPNVENSSFLVTLEDQQQSAQYRAYAEAQRYSLTERETEVWVLKRIGLTYKAIAAKLHIAEDTVKKHIKNIHARRDAAHWANG
jgi:DNA-binding CsgD family transcriptional regulator